MSETEHHKGKATEVKPKEGEELEDIAVVEKEMSIKDALTSDADEQQLFEATEGKQEAGKFGKKPQRRDDI